MLLAIALSPLKLVLPDESQRSFRIEWEICAIVGIALVVNLVATLPCFWGGFVSTSRAIVVVPCWLAYCLVVTGLEVAVFYFIRHGPNSDIWDFFLFFDANVTQGAVVFGVMYCYRALGYRLLRVPREMPLPEPVMLLDDMEEPTILTDADLVGEGDEGEN